MNLARLKLIALIITIFAHAETLNLYVGVTNATSDINECYVNSSITPCASLDIAFTAIETNSLEGDDVMIVFQEDGTYETCDADLSPAILLNSLTIISTAANVEINCASGTSVATINGAHDLTLQDLTFTNIDTTSLVTFDSTSNGSWSITGCTFSLITVAYGLDVPISSSYLSLSITDSVFHSISASIGASVLSVESAQLQTLEFTNVNISDQVSEDVGAIYLDAAGSLNVVFTKMDIQSVNINEITQGNIFQLSDVDSATLQNITIHDIVGTGNSENMCLNFAGGNLTLIDVNVRALQFAGVQGAECFLITSADYVSFERVVVEDFDCTNDQGGASGVIRASEYSFFSIRDSSFSNISHNAGGILVSISQSLFQETEWHNVEAFDIHGESSSVVMVTTTGLGGSMIMTDCHFHDMSATGTTAGFQFFPGWTLHASDSIFESMYCGEGCALVLVNGADAYLTRMIFRDIHVDNEAAVIGVFADNIVYMDECLVTGNSAAEGVGLFLESGDGEFIIMNSNFTNNVATVGDSIIGSPTYLEVTNCIFTNNTIAATSGPTVIRFGADSGANATITSSVFTDNAGGSVIYSTHENATLTMSDCTFEDNIGGDDGGSSIGFTAGGALDLSNTVFQKQTCSGNGGAIDVFDATISIESCSFIENTAESGDGGSISARGSSSISVKDSILTMNSAGRDGGAIYWTGHGEMLIQNTEVSDNQCSGNGGGVFSRSNVVYTISDTNFSSNEAISLGGAFYCGSSGQGNFNNVNLLSNRAQGGGAVHIGQGSTTSFTNIICTENTASGSGGCLNFQSDVIVNIEDAEINQNSGGNFGGGIFLFDGSLNLSDVTFDSNTIDSGAGGALYLLGTLSAVNVSMTSNSAPGAGAIGLVPTSDVSISASEFNYNSASQNGGVIVINRNGDSNVLFTNCSFEQNSASLSGGVVVDSGGQPYETNLTFQDCIFDENSARYDGGVLMVLNSHIEAYNTRFSNNHADEGAGGTIYVVGSDETTVISSSHLSSSNSASSGGCILQEGGKLIISASEFDACVSQESGGALSLSSVTANIENSNFMNCEATQQHGGFISAFLSDLDISQVSFLSGMTAFNGGAIAVNADELGEDAISSTVSISDTSFQNVSAGKSGGAIFVGSEVSSFTMNSSNIIYASADAGSGGSIYFESAGEFSIDDSSITNTYASLVGGGIAVDGEESTLMLSSSKISECGATLGGAVYVNLNSTLSLNSVLIESNSAADGGGLYLLGSLTSEDSIFQLNGASTDEDATCSAVSLVVGEGRGGAIYLSGGNCDNLDIGTNNTFSKNTALLSGGAIEIEDYDSCFDSLLEEPEFIDNEAEYGESFSSQFSSFQISSDTSSISTVTVRSNDNSITITPGDTVGIVLEMLDGFGSVMTGEHETIAVVPTVSGVPDRLNSLGTTASVAVNGVADVRLQFKWDSGVEDLEETVEMTVTLVTVPESNSLTFGITLKKCETGFVLNEEDGVCQENFSIEGIAFWVIYAVEGVLLVCGFMMVVIGNNVKYTSLLNDKTLLLSLFGCLLVWISQLMLLIDRNVAVCHFIFILSEIGYLFVLAPIVHVLQFVNNLVLEKNVNFSWKDFDRDKLDNTRKMIYLPLGIQVLLFIVWLAVSTYTEENNFCDSTFENYFIVILFGVRTAFIVTTVFALYKLSAIWSPLNDMRFLSMILFNSLIVFALFLMIEVLVEFSYYYLLIFRFILWAYYLFSTLCFLILPRAKIVYSSRSAALLTSTFEDRTVKQIRYELENGRKKYDALQENIREMEKQLEKLAKNQMKSAQ